MPGVNAARACSVDVHKPLRISRERPASYAQAPIAPSRRLHELLLQGEILARTSPGVTQLKAAKKSLRNEVRVLLREAGLQQQVMRCQTIEGLGFLAAAMLVTAYSHDTFKSVNAYISFLNRELRSATAEQSDLLRKNNAMIHPLLLDSAIAASRLPAWRGLYQQYRKTGKSSLRSFEMLARRLARLAFSVLEAQGEYIGTSTG